MNVKHSFSNVLFEFLIEHEKVVLSIVQDFQPEALYLLYYLLNRIHILNFADSLEIIIF